MSLNDLDACIYILKPKILGAELVAPALPLASLIRGCNVYHVYHQMAPVHRPLTGIVNQLDFHSIYVPCFLNKFECSGTDLTEIGL